MADLAIRLPCASADTVGLRVSLAEAELARGDVASARDEIERAWRAAPGDLRVIDRFAVIALLAGDAAAVLRVAGPQVARLSRDGAMAVDAAALALGPWLDDPTLAARAQRAMQDHPMVRDGLAANRGIEPRRPTDPPLAADAEALERLFCTLWSVPTLDASGHARATFDWLMRAVRDVGPGDLVLDAGAGQCRYAPFFAHARYLPVDFGKGDEEWDYRRIACFADLEALPLAPCSVHMVINTSVMEHVRHPARALAEFWRVLRWGGSLRMYVPFVYGIHQTPHDYFRFTRFAWQALAEEAGFRRVDVTEASSDFYAAAHWFRHAVLGIVPELSEEMRAVVGLFLRDAMPVLEAAESRGDQELPIGYFVDAWKLP